MKRPIIFIVAALIVSVSCIWMWQQRSSRIRSVRLPLVDANNTGATQQAKLSPGSRWGTEMFDNLRNLSLRPIDFYGKVVDQDGKPLFGVQVTGSVGRDVGFARAKGGDYFTSTDKAGCFKFEGLQGNGIGITLRKDGYNLGTKQRHFPYSLMVKDDQRHNPDRKTPVVFTMWKSLGAEPMISQWIDCYHIPVDGSPVHFDLETGKRVQEGGDLEIVVRWDLQNGMRDGFWNWSVKFAAMDGGIVEGGAEQMFIAPASGYRPYVEYTFTTEDRVEGRDGEYYLESRNGKNHARVKISLNNARFESRASVIIRSWLNPSSSRNLEYDPTKRIEVPK